MSFSIPAPSSGVALLASFGRSWHSHIPFGLLFNFQGTVRRSFTYSHWERANGNPKREKYFEFEKPSHLFPLGRAKLSGVFEKIFCFAKDPFTHLDKGGRNAHPFPSFFSKIFWEKILPFTYLELQSQMTPYFTEKMRKYFLSGCWMAYFYLPKISLHLFGIRRLKRTLFLRNIWKVFFKRIFRLKKHLSLIPTGRGQMHTLNPKNFFTPSLIWNWNAKTQPVFKKKFENRQKICPPEVAGVFVFAWNRQHDLFIINR